MGETIASIKDERIILARAIKSPRGRREHRKILLEGREILDWAVENGLGIEYLLVSERISAQAADWYPGIDAFTVSEGILKKVTDTSYVLQPRPVALVVGNETDGISAEIEKLADFLVQIPMFHAMESLNVGVAAGISVYELKLKQVLTMIEQKIKSTLGRELNVAGMLVQCVLDAELKKVTRLTSRQVIFMMVLKCDGSMSRDGMGRQFGVLEKEAAEFLGPLLDAGLVVEGNDLRLTEKGEEALAKLWFTIENAQERILSSFTPGEAEAFLRQLSQIQEQCVNILKTNKE